jgi:hypothetical protein
MRRPGRAQPDDKDPVEYRGLRSIGACARLGMGPIRQPPKMADRITSPSRTLRVRHSTVNAMAQSSGYRSHPAARFRISPSPRSFVSGYRFQVSHRPVAPKLRIRVSLQRYRKFSSIRSPFRGLAVDLIRSATRWKATKNPAPEGQPKIAQRFSAGKRSPQPGQVPEGRLQTPFRRLTVARKPPPPKGKKRPSNELATHLPAAQPQLPLPKGDIPNGAPKPTFLLTYIEKPIIINSFHGGRGAIILPYGFSLFQGNPLSPPWNQTKHSSTHHSTRGYIFHG